MSHRRAGFTFVEMLVALLVMSILASLTVPRYRNYKEKAYLSVLRTDLGNLRLAEEAFWSEHMRYSMSAPTLDFKPSSHVALTLRAPDPAAGYTAIARHELLPDRFCQMVVGRPADGSASGEIVCNDSRSGLGSATPDSQ